MFSLIILFQLLQNPVARIHYGGGGDWYGNKTTFKNIYRLYEKTFQNKLPLQEETVTLSANEMFSYPILYLAGHGNIYFEENEVSQLRTYLLGGGFLFLDDDFGMDKFIRREMKKVLPESEFIELPYSNPIFAYPYTFKNGLPKVHEHAGGPPHAYGLFYKNRLVAFYSFNTDISDGCEDKDIHNDSDAVRLDALKMAVNIISYALNN